MIVASTIVTVAEAMLLAERGQGALIDGRQGCFLPQTCCSMARACFFVWRLWPQP